MYGISGFDFFFVCNLIHINTKKIHMNFLGICLYVFFVFVCME